jgi:hypothetical protein
MSTYEFVLRILLLAVGLVLMLVGAAVARWTDREMTHFVLLGVGFACIAVATDTE